MLQGHNTFYFGITVLIASGLISLLYCSFKHFISTPNTSDMGPPNDNPKKSSKADKKEEIVDLDEDAHLEALTIDERLTEELSGAKPKVGDLVRGVAEVISDLASKAKAKPSGPKIFVASKDVGTPKSQIPIPSYESSLTAADREFMKDIKTFTLDGLDTRTYSQKIDRSCLCEGACNCQPISAPPPFIEKRQDPIPEEGNTDLLGLNEYLSLRIPEDFTFTYSTNPDTIGSGDDLMPLVVDNERDMRPVLDENSSKPEIPTQDEDEFSPAFQARWIQDLTSGRKMDFFDYFFSKCENHSQLFCNDKEMAILEARLSLTFSLLNSTARQVDKLTQQQQGTDAKLQAIIINQQQMLNLLLDQSKNTRNTDSVMVNAYSSLNTISGTLDDVTILGTSTNDLILKLSEDVGVISDAISQIKDACDKVQVEYCVPPGGTAPRQDRVPTVKPDSKEDSQSSLTKEKIRALVAQYIKTGGFNPKIDYVIGKIVSTLRDLGNYTDEIKLLVMSRIDRNGPIAESMLTTLGFDQCKDMYRELDSVDWNSQETIFHELLPVILLIRGRVAAKENPPSPNVEQAIPPRASPDPVVSTMRDESRGRGGRGGRGSYPSTSTRPPPSTARPSSITDILHQVARSGRK